MSKRERPGAALVRLRWAKATPDEKATAVRKMNEARAAKRRRTKRAARGR